ncbi:flagellar hook-basal body complex protein FliE [Coralliovum pocilloporae]|uniref:flagellar hook-basal body complex protein FliE n=1 Tax=Coralliovum pocilloporae TaxID=3066369 RepID=UPI003306D9F3
MTSPLSAANAYSAISQLSNPTETSQGLSSAATGGMDFGQIIKEAAGSVIESGKVSDQKAADMLQGKANVVDVVTAVAETEVALESMVSMRDRMISAYETVMRMPI